MIMFVVRDSEPSKMGIASPQKWGERRSVFFFFKERNVIVFRGHVIFRRGGGGQIVSSNKNRAAKYKNTVQALKYLSADAVTLYARFQGN